MLLSAVRFLRRHDPKDETIPCSSKRSWQWDLRVCCLTEPSSSTNTLRAMLKVTQVDGKAHEVSAS